MPTYTSEVKTSANFTGNVVVKFGGHYFSIRQPDSGLDIPKEQRRCVTSLVINPTTIDPKRVSTTIGQYSFTILDRHGILSSIIKDTGANVIGQTLELWIGRSGVSMAFSDYYKMPDTRISKVDKVPGGWSFSTKESTDRMNRPLFQTTARLSGDIVSGTTIISSSDDISDFPASGKFKIDGEIISYTSKDNGTKTFSGCARGEFGTTPAEHEASAEMKHVQTLSSVNPINILLQLLTSGSGTGSYDLLDDGLAIDVALIDVTAIEALRDNLFPTTTFSLALYGIDNALQYIEREILSPLNLRFTYGTNSKLTLKKLNSTEFVEIVDTINHDSIVGLPKMSIDETKIVNRITVNYDYDEDNGRFRTTRTYTDDDSITTYGKSISPLTFSWKGVSDGDFVDAYAAELLERLATPKPEVEVKCFVSKSLLNVADPGRVETRTLPNSNGELNFASDMEIVNRAINYQTGEVRLKLVYTGYTGIRFGYIAPTASISAVVSQTRATLPAGRTDLFQVGWKMRLWDVSDNEYEADPVNTIAEIDGNDLVFENAWSTTLDTGHRFKFADFDQVAETQKRYAFVGNPAGADFSSLEKSYKITP